MVVDTSALVAILPGEPEASQFSLLIDRDAVRLASSVSILDASIVLGARKGPAGIGELDLLLHRASIEQVPFNQKQVELARREWLRFGKGRHRAALNFGDCCSYALAAVTGEPLLARGDDFNQTGIALAAPQPLPN